MCHVKLLRTELRWLLNVCVFCIASNVSVFTVVCNCLFSVRDYSSVLILCISVVCMLIPSWLCNDVCNERAYFQKAGKLRLNRTVGPVLVMEKFHLNSYSASRDN